ncbi:hypothetical protein [Actinomycetospora sp. CA-053990]|uniref:hypothetical protein n=1 Tax=Actinomycetospora sp. CA-053990 TaxID=3239891 RepID=UPI003D90EDFC
MALADPQVRCTLDDERLAETSGLVAEPGGTYEVVNDSGNASTVYVLDDRCAVIGEREVPEQGRDVEDLARGADGTLWIADIGDNGRRRSSVAVLRLAPGGDETVTRFTYPDGAHDAESLLVPGDDRPVIVTKDLSGRSGVYVAERAPGDSEEPQPLRRAGEVVVPGEAITSVGSGTYTGGAISADGRVVALRTYTDAWLYPAPGGTATAEDVVTALASPPVRVPLAGEVQGEALAFAPDGTLLATGRRRRASGRRPCSPCPGRPRWRPRAPRPRPPAGRPRSVRASRSRSPPSAWSSPSPSGCSRSSPSSRWCAGVARPDAANGLFAASTRANSPFARPDP